MMVKLYIDSFFRDNQEIQLIVTADDGTWDVYMDYLEINE